MKTKIFFYILLAGILGTLMACNDDAETKELPGNITGNLTVGNEVIVLKGGMVDNRGDTDSVFYRTTFKFKLSTDAIVNTGRKFAVYVSSTEKATITFKLTSRDNTGVIENGVYEFSPLNQNNANFPEGLILHSAVYSVSNNTGSSSNTINTLFKQGHIEIDGNYPFYNVKISLLTEDNIQVVGSGSGTFVTRDTWSQQPSGN